MIQNKYKILVVEDDANIRTIVTTILESSGYQVLLAECCSIAKTLYASYLPDLIILDLGLPDMDGMNLLDYVRQDSLTPIIVLSARSDDKDKVTALDKGANDYVTKPFSAAELLARIRSALRNSRFSSAEGRLPGGKFTFRDLEIIYDARQVFVKGEEIKLKGKAETVLVPFRRGDGRRKLPRGSWRLCSLCSRCHPHSCSLSQWRLWN